jgi:hypothetical protein
MLDDAEEKGQGPSATVADQSLSPLQQLKALFNKLDMESKQRRWMPTSHAHHGAQQGIQSTNDPFSVTVGRERAPTEATGQGTVAQRPARSSSEALFGRANCLVLDIEQLPADLQTAVEALAASAGRMDKRVEVASVVRAFPALAAAAPVAVMLQAGRLHMHFRQPAHMLAASTAVPACALLSAGVPGVVAATARLRRRTTRRSGNAGLHLPSGTRR